MKVHAASLGFLALFATLGLVAAQNHPAREPDPAKPGEQAAASQEREPDVRAITDLLASFVKAYNEKDAKALGALFTPDAEIEDEDGEVTRGRDAIVGRFSGIFKESGGDRLAVDTDSLRFLGNGYRHRGGYGVDHDGAGATARHEPVQRDLRPPGRPLAPRQDPRRTARRGLSRTSSSCNWNGCSASGSTRATTGSSRPTASGRMTATSCSVNSTSRSRGASPCAAPSASAGTHSGSSSGCGSSMTGAASPRGCCRVMATAGSPRRRESARTDNRSQPRTRSRRSARTGSSGRRWSERSAAKPCLAPISIYLVRPAPLPGK